MSHSIEALKWRYATKQYDTEKKLSTEQVQTMKDALRLAPSSFGLQPWHFVMVEDAELRKKLRAAGYDQPQITEASHFLVLAAEKNVDASLVDAYMKNIAKTRGISEESLDGFRTMLNGSIEMKGETGAHEWAVRQTYIALGVLLSVAGAEGIDATPMEGFDPSQFDQILGLDKQGLKSYVMVALGFRKDDDPASKMEKVRLSEEEVFTTM